MNLFRQFQTKAMPIVGFLILSVLFINCDRNHEFSRDPSVLNTVSPSDPVVGGEGTTPTTPNTDNPDCWTCGNYTPTTGIGSGNAQALVFVSTASNNSLDAIRNSNTDALNYAVVDGVHSAFSELRLWRDRNGNGVIVDSDEAASELTTLAQEGISSLSFDTSTSNGIWETYVSFSDNDTVLRGLFLTTFPSGN